MMYYYVPPCPNCGSRKTGQLKEKPWSNAETIVQNARRHGELIRFVDRISQDNAFCAECNYTWGADIIRLWLSKSEIRVEKESRGISEETQHTPEKKGLLRRMITGFTGI